MTTRWRMMSDDDGHWYVIPANRREEFDAWVYGGSNNGVPQPDWAWSINGHLSNVTFSEVDISGDRISG